MPERMTQGREAGDTLCAKFEKAEAELAEIDAWLEDESRGGECVRGDSNTRMEKLQDVLQTAKQYQGLYNGAYACAVKAEADLFFWIAKLSAEAEWTADELSDALREAGVDPERFAALTLERVRRALRESPAHWQIRRELKLDEE